MPLSAIDIAVDQAFRKAILETRPQLSRSRTLVIPEEREAIRAAYLRGESVKVIAFRFYRGESTVHKIVRDIKVSKFLTITCPSCGAQRQMFKSVAESRQSHLCRPCSDHRKRRKQVDGE